MGERGKPALDRSKPVDRVVIERREVLYEQGGSLFRTSGEWFAFADWVICRDTSFVEAYDYVVKFGEPKPTKQQALRQSPLGWPKSTVTKGKRALTQAIIDQHEKLCAADYDGVLGALPSWVPPPHRDAFFEARMAVINGCAGDTAKATEVFGVFCRLSGIGAIVEEPRYKQRIAPKLMPYLTKLREIYLAVRSGPEKGLAALGGKVAAHGFKFGGRKKGAISKPALHIEEILRENRHLSAKAICKILEHAGVVMTVVAVQKHRSLALKRIAKSKKARSDI